jgi:hypothetical protein
MPGNAMEHSVCEHRIETTKKRTNGERYAGCLGNGTFSNVVYSAQSSEPPLIFLRMHTKKYTLVKKKKKYTITVTNSKRL